MVSQRALHYAYNAEVRSLCNRSYLSSDESQWVFSTDMFIEAAAEVSRPSQPLQLDFVRYPRAYIYRHQNW